MPQVGLGTGRGNKDLENAHEMIKHAIVNCGYRLIDTAKIYDTEGIIAEVLQEIFQEGTLKREDLFITTKLWPTDKEDVEGALRGSLARLKLDSVDLYLVHWMCPKIDWSNPSILNIAPISNEQTWREMERMVELGLTKSIGVSNCGTQVLLDMMTYCKIKPAVNQFECHPSSP